MSTEGTTALQWGKSSLTPPSHRWREPVLAEVHARRLKRSIGLLLCRGDENLHPRFKLTLVARRIGDDRSIRRDDHLLFSLLVFQGQRLPVDPGDNVVNIGVRHGALGL